MRNVSAARVFSSAVAGLAVVASGLAGAAAPARAAAGAPRPGATPGGVISTVAGGVGGPGPATSVAMLPCGLRWAGGSLYIGDLWNVRRVSTATGALTTIAGDWATGPADDSSAAVSAPIDGACGSVLDGAGNLVVASGRVVRVVAARTGTFYGQKMRVGHIYTVAGGADRTRDSGRPGDGGPATSATFETAVDVAIDRSGNLVISDSGLPRICLDCLPLGALVRVVATRTGTFYGKKMTAGDIYTVAGRQGSGPVGNGGAATKAWLGTTIGSVRRDGAGNLILGDNGETDLDGAALVAPSVRVIAAATGTFYGQKMTAGHIYRIAGNGRIGSAGNGGLATKASLKAAESIALDGAGNVVIGDQNQVRVIAARTGRLYGQQMTAHHIYAIAGTAKAGDSGDGGPADRARISAGAVALDAAGNVLLAEPLRVRVVAARSASFYGHKMTARHIYTVAGNGLQFSGDGRPALEARFFTPTGVSVDGAGDIAISAVTPDIVDLIPAWSGVLFGRPMTAGKLYTVAGDGKNGFSGDNGPARRATFNLSSSGTTVAFDPSGNLVVADAGNSRVRLVAVRSGRFYGQNMTAGDIYTIAGSGVQGFSGDGGPAVKADLGLPSSAGVDHDGNVLIIDGRIRVVAATTGTFYGQNMTAGDIYTVAGDGSGVFSGDGGPAVKAGMAPQAVTVDAAGNLIVDDLGRVRVVAVQTGTMYGQAMTADDIYTIAGSGEKGAPSGSGGPALAARFATGGLAVDQDGNVVLADWSDSRVWVVAATTGTFYGQAMTAGDIYIVSGGGATLGDGGPAASALLHFPFAVAMSSTGGLLVIDSGDHRLREIAP